MERKQEIEQVAEASSLTNKSARRESSECERQRHPVEGEHTEPARFLCIQKNLP